MRLVATAVAAASLLLASSASASMQRVPCRTSYDGPHAVCHTLRVPIDRSGAVAGNVSLFVERIPARGQSRGAVAVFPGGPGLSASLIGNYLARQFRDITADHDLILFDQRGTGRSDFVDCDTALYPTYFVPAGLESLQLSKTVERCAHKLGPKRSYYTSAETVADFDAIRSALGIDKVTMIGVSYGTRDSMEYARTFPQHVDKLVLDSTVADPDPVEPMGLSQLRAVARVLRQQCIGGACAGFTDDPAADLATLEAQLGKGAIHSPPIGRHGCRAGITITRRNLWGTISLADFDSRLLSQLPYAIARAARGHTTELATLIGFNISDRFWDCFSPPDDGSDRGPKITPDDRKYGRLLFSSGEEIARVCEENPMPWGLDTPVTERRRLFEQSFMSLSDAEFWPFDRATAMSNVLPPLCKYWPRARQTPLIVGGKLPDNVPTLIVSGLDDLRTPTEDAIALQQANPSARLLQVPNIGHSALDAPCAARALRAFLANQPIVDCKPTPRHVPAPVRRIKLLW